MHLLFQAAMRTKFSEKIRTIFIWWIDKKLLREYNYSNGYKGQREKLKAIASEMGMSMNQMFIKAVEEYIEKNYKPEAESETDWQIEICTEYFLKKLLTTKLLYSII